MLKGSIVALVTPFKKDLSIDDNKLRELINWHIKKGTDAILVCGTTGESATQTHDEHRKIIDTAIEEVNGRVPVVAGCGSNSTEEALGLVKYAQEKGADYALVITPYYNKPTQQGLYEHFRYIARNSSIPVLLYNVPGRTGVNMLPETTAKLYKEFDNIAGSKEATGSLEQNIALMSLVDENFLLFSGDDATILPMISIGSRGVISVIANILPDMTHELADAALNGDYARARRLQFDMYELIRAMFIETNPIPVKTALSMMGICQADFRLPLCGMTDSNRALLQSLLKKRGLI